MKTPSTYVSAAPSRSRASNCRNALEPILTELHHARRQVVEEEASLEQARTHETAVREAQALAQALAEQVQKEAHVQIAGVVNRCLRAVFEDDAPGFRILFERKRGKTEATLAFVRGGQVLDDPLDQDCGGVVDVAALALRLTCLALARPRRRLLVVADEPLKNLNGEEYQERVAGMILSLARDLGVQFVFTSDDPWLKVGKVVELG